MEEMSKESSQKATRKGKRRTENLNKEDWKEIRTKRGILRVEY